LSCVYCDQCLCPVSIVPSVASVFVLYLLCPVLPVSLSCVYCAQCCECLCPVSIVPSVASVFVLCLLCPVLRVSLSCVYCAQCWQCLWTVHSWLPLQFSVTFICMYTDHRENKSYRQWSQVIHLVFFIKIIL
jgi:hypothetical protein